MAKRIKIKDENRSRIVLSRERDIERKLAEKSQIDRQLEEYMKQYADITGINKVVGASYLARERKRKALVTTLIALGVIVLVVGALVAFELLK